MSEEAHEECGICAVSLRNNPKTLDAPSYLFNLMLQMQNRGQLGAGMTTYNPKRDQLLVTHRELGLVKEAFKTSNPPKYASLMKSLAGTSGIGHVRYATFGLDNVSYSQPFERFHGRTWKWFSFGFNGNLANYWTLRSALEQKNYHFQLESDSEVMMHYLAYGCRGDTKPELEHIFSGIAEKFDGAYNIVFQNADGELVASRDPNGIKPLSFGLNDNLFAAASESASLESVGLEKIQAIEPGEMVIIPPNGEMETKRYAKSHKKSVCMFEFVYFSHQMSNIDSVNVYASRYAMGKELAKQETLPIDSDCVVVPVPETARPVADAYGYELGIPVLSGLVKNDYIGRTFIESTERDAKVMAKFSLNKKIVNGKKIILIEDSIVRGTTTKAIVRLLRQKGNVKSIHVRSACPPIVFPCFYGIDFSTLNELIASRHRKEKETGIHDFSEKEEQTLADEIGADSVHYQTLEGLSRAIGFDNGKKSLCLGCLTGQYPTPEGQKLVQICQTERNATGQRTYEQKTTVPKNG